MRSIPTEDILRERRRIQPNENDDFTVRDMSQIVATMSSTTVVLTGLLSAVAAAYFAVIFPLSLYLRRAQRRAGPARQGPTRRS